jgi:hypothetical protein
MKKSKKLSIIIICLALLILGVITIWNAGIKPTDKVAKSTVDAVIENPVDKVEEKTVENVSTSQIQSSGEKLNVNIGVGQGSVDGDVTIPIEFNNDSEVCVDACDFKIMFDPSVLEATGVTYGDIVVAGNESFTSEIDNSKGVISFLFMDNTLGKQPIVEMGIFSNITFKVKKDVANGSSAISLQSVGAFVDEALSEHEVTFKDGSVSILEN